MTSKNSFWKLSIWNIRKRSWIAALCCGAWFFALPVLTYLMTSSGLHDFKQGMQTAENLQGLKYSLLTTSFYSELHLIITVILAVIMPIQAFGWLNKRQKVDMYKSVPVKETTRFIYTHLNSLLMFGVPMAVGLFASNLITIFFGVYDPHFTSASCALFVICILTFVGVYMLVLIAQLLTGNMVLAFFGGIFLLFWEMVCRFSCWGYQSLFFHTMYGDVWSRSDLFANTLTSPLATGICSFFSYENGAWEPSAYGWDYYYYRMGLGVISNDVYYAFLLLVQILVYTAVAFFLYKHRPSHTGGKSIVFAKVIPVIKFAVIFVVSILCGIMICSVGYEHDQEVSYGFLGIILSALLIHIIFCAILEGDFYATMKRVVKSLPASLISCGLACFLFSIYSFDLFGYNTYLPKEDDLESFAFVRDEEYEVTSFLNQDASYGINNMKITDADAKEILLSVLRDAMERNQYNSENEFGGYKEVSVREALGIDSDLIYEDGECAEYVTVSYNLKNGKSEKRRYCLTKTDIRKVYAAIFELPEYRAVANHFLDDSLMDMIYDEQNKITATYVPFDYDYVTRGIGIKKLSQAELKKLCEAAKEDISARKYEDILKKAPIARWSVEIESDDIKQFDQYRSSNRRANFDVVVYESDDKMMEVIKELGIYKDITIPTDQVKEVKLYYNQYVDKGGSETLGEKHMLTLPAENEKAKELLEHAYPTDVDAFVVDIGILRKYNYYIEVIPVSGDRQTVTYALYTQDFSGEWEETMEDAEIIWEDNVYR